MLVVCSLNRPHLHHPCQVSPVRNFRCHCKPPPASPLHQTCYSGGMGWVLWVGSGEGRSKQDCLVTLEVLQLIALPRGGSPGAGGHSGQEPTLQPGPHPQDAHTQGPKAVVSQPELHADSGMNLNQTLPHGSPGKRMLLQWKPAGQGDTGGKDGKPATDKGFVPISAHGGPFAAPPVLEGGQSCEPQSRLSCREGAAREAHVIRGLDSARST